LRVARTLLIALAALVGLVVLAIVVAKLIPNQTYKGWIESAVTSSTGHEFEIAGDFTVDIGTTVRITAEDVSFANADWSASPAMLTAKHVGATARVWPLLNRLLEVTVKAESPALLLETNAAGHGNWDMPSDQAEEQDEDKGVKRTRIRIVPRDIEITDARVTYLRGGSGSTKLAEIDQFRLGTEGEKPGVTLTGRYNDQPVTLVGALSELEKLQTEEPVALALNGQLGQVSVSVEGSVANIMSAAGPTVGLALGVVGPATQVFDPWVAGELPDLGALDFAARVNGSAGAYVADKLRLKLSGDAAIVDIEGQIDDLKDFQGIDARAQIKTTALPAIIEAFGIDVPTPLPQSVEASGVLRGGKGALAIHDLRASIEDAQVSVTLTGSAVDVVTRQGLVADVHVTAGSLAILSKFVGQELPATGSVNARAHVSADDSIYAISELDLEVEGDALNGKLSGAVADLANWRGVDVTLDANVGSLTQFSDLIKAELPETDPLAVKARVSEGAQGAAQIAADIEGDGLRANFQGAVQDLRAIKGVDGDVSIELNSLQQIAALTGIDLPTFFPLSASGHVTSKDTAYEVTDLTVHVDDEKLKLELAGSIGDALALSGVNLELSGRLSSLAELSTTFGRDLPETGPLDVSAKLGSSDGTYILDDLNLTLAGEVMDATVTGSIADLLKLKGINLDLNGHIRSLTDLSNVLEKPLPETAPLEVSAQFTAEQGAQGPGNVVASVQGKWLNAEAKGRIGELREFKDVDADVSLTLASLISIGNLAGASLPDMGPLNASGHIRSRDTSYELTDINAVLADEALEAHLTGAITDLLAVTGVNLELAATTPSLARLSRFIDTELPDTGPFEMQASVQAESGIAAPTTLSAKVNSETLSGSIEGTLAELKSLDELDVDLTLAAATLETIGQLAGATLSPSGPVTASAKMVHSNGRLALDPLELTIGDSRLDGSFQYVTHADDPNTKGAIRGRLASRHIDLNEIFDIEPGVDDHVPPELPPAGTAAGEKAKVPEETAEGVFTDTQLPLDWLRRHDIDLQFESERLKILHTDIHALSVATTVDGGVSKTELTRGRIGDQPIEASVTLDATVQPPTVRIQVDLDQIPLPPISQLDAVLQGGVLVFKVDVAGAGVSMREVMGHLNGHVLLAIRDSRTPNNLLNRFGAGISISSINPFDESEEYTTLHCAASHFEFTDGVATTPRGLAIQVPRVTWLGSGQIDFKNETIDLRVQPRARRSVLSSSDLVRMLQFRGPLTNPRLVANPVGLATSGASVALAFSTGGVSLLWQGLYGLFRANADRCKRIEKQIVKIRATGEDG